jgi:hypothetical protein
MKRITMYVCLLTLSTSLIARSKTEIADAIFESQDGITVLVVSGDYFYLGPKNHPEITNFVSIYGEKIGHQTVQGVKCLVFGALKIAVFNGATSFCQGVRISKLHSSNKSTVGNYSASCFEFQKDICVKATGNGKAALGYGFKVGIGRGVTEIYLSEETSRSSSNVLMLKNGSLLVK